MAASRSNRTPLGEEKKSSANGRTSSRTPRHRVPCPNGFFRQILDEDDRLLSIKEADKRAFVDPFFCNCIHCQEFYSKHLPANIRDVLVLPGFKPSKRSMLLVDRFKKYPQHPSWIKLGDRVIVQGRYPGFVKYVGVLDEDDLAAELYVGVKLDDPVGMEDGFWNNKFYFSCPKGHGVMVRYSEVRKVCPPTRRPRTAFSDWRYYHIPGQRRSRSASDPGTDLSHTSSDKFRSHSSDPTSLQSTHSNRAPPHFRDEPKRNMQRDKSSSTTVSSSYPSSRYQKQTPRRDASLQERERTKKENGDVRSLSATELRMEDWRTQYGEDQAMRMSAALTNLQLAWEKGKEETQKVPVAPKKK
ncbi:CAP-Gly domain-containing linker protein 4-like isoform X1 [Branchiostoma lanceolatum]|uniref:CAP-Gly domain-containing linker protein 4-like isoform X1 n=1 Tax=Branchiostoma lanceolatum TaxID=7740 RepID=UPI0034558378